MANSGFEKLAKKFVKHTLATLPRTKSGSGWFIANDKLDEIALDITSKFLNFKEIKDRLDAKKGELVRTLIDAERRTSCKQYVIDAILDSID